MKLIKDKQILVAADKAGFPLKEAVVRHLKQQGWTVTDIGVQSADDPNPEMFHRIGIAAGTKIAEKEFERALLFCGTGMGIHIAASKCPGVMAGVVENLPSALRAITGNNVNCLAIGAYYVAPNLAIDMVDAYLSHSLGDTFEWREKFYEYHKLAYDELMAFNYEEDKRNGFQMKHLGECVLPPLNESL